MTEETKKAIEEFKPGIYEHFKGKSYLALTLATDCEDIERKLVIYISLYKNKNGVVWSREVTDFMGYKTLESGEKVKRFEFIKAV
jgi:hypothetical protein